MLNIVSIDTVIHSNTFKSIDQILTELNLPQNNHNRLVLTSILLKREDVEKMYEKMPCATQTLYRKIREPDEGEDK
ncbi:hypothetical protein KGA34_002593 [Enterococcus faecalis]|nr:hypothetical protein [Enterococcus faecalis]EHM3140225.1 hypothetical protein [Enterococcus faecalis]EJE4049235.1 hypothetical protein [Enterococcus faecalis]